MVNLRAVGALVDFAEGQWGLVTVAQAASVGTTAPMVAELVDHRLVEPVLDGVVRIRGGARHPFIRTYAAWLLLQPATPAWERAVPDSGVTSHHSALRLHRVGDLPGPHPQFTVGRGHQPHPARPTTVHTGALSTAEVWLIDDLPVTAPARTLADLMRAGVEVSDLISVGRRFVTAQLVTVGDLVSALAELDPRRGSDVLAALTTDDDAAV